MGGLFKHGAIAKSLGYFDSSRAGRRGKFSDLDKADKLSKSQRQAFLAREDAKISVGDGLAAQTPLTSRYS